MSDRKNITAALGKLLEKDRFSGAGKYWAKEVTFDYGQPSPIRVDYMQFKPHNQLAIDGIEKGEFICYEVKSCKEDFYSGFGLNFISEKNYLVMTMETYNDLKNSHQIDKLPHFVGILVPIPKKMKYASEQKKYDLTQIGEFSKEKDLNDWYLENIKPAKKTYRKRPMTEMLFCMLRSSINNTKGENNSEL